MNYSQYLSTTVSIIHSVSDEQTSSKQRSFVKTVKEFLNV